MSESYICKVCENIYDEDEVELRSYEGSKVPLCDNCDMSDIDENPIDGLVVSLNNKDYDVSFKDYRNIENYKKDIKEEIRNLDDEYLKEQYNKKSRELEKELLNKLSLTSGKSKPILSLDSSSDMLFRDVSEFLEDYDDYYCKKTLDFGIIIFKETESSEDLL
jgi:hypothetical protein